MALSKTDKKIEIMAENHGTVCLISQAGKADKLLEISKRRQLAIKKQLSEPIDAWEI